jgi:hypothetical protein
MPFDSQIKEKKHVLQRLFFLRCCIKFTFIGFVVHFTPLKLFSLPSLPTNLTIIGFFLKGGTIPMKLIFFAMFSPAAAA